MSIWHQFFSLLFPDICTGCNNVLLRSENILCTDCILILPKANIGFANSQNLENRFEGKVKIKAAISYFKFTKGSKVQNILHNLKYKNRPEIALFLGKLFGENVKNDVKIGGINLLVGVPLHYKKQIIRGFNQSDLLAEGISEILGVPHETKLLIRKIDTQTQTKKTRIDRYFNVKNVFEVVDREKVIGKSIGLVDDVLTTGATLEVCAQALLDAGAKDITILCLAAAE